MYRKLGAAAVIAILMFTAGGPIESMASGPRCAFVSGVSGKALVKRDGKYYLIKGMDGLYCGDEVKVMKDARLMVAECGQGTRMEVVGPAEFTVARDLVFKKGKAGERVKIDSGLCPLFLAQAFDNVRPSQVDANGRDLPKPPEMLGTAVMKSMAPSGPSYQPFPGYISYVNGDVFLSRPRVLKVTGDTVPRQGAQILARSGATVSIFVCGEGKRYNVEGPATVQLGDLSVSASVTLVSGQPLKVEDIDPAACEGSRRAIMESRQNNTSPVGLDGK